MIDVRIVCTYDALGAAQSIMRRLEAEQHKVELSYGRFSLAQLDTAREKNEAVLLIWSVDAPSALYMLQWAMGVEAGRLVEIARAPSWPPLERRRAPVIDFSGWGGERGGPAWRALTERLKHIERGGPERPSAKTLAAWGAAAGIAAAAAGVVGAQFLPQAEAPGTATASMTPEQIAAATLGDAPAPGGSGGPLVAPVSLDDAFTPGAPSAHVRPLPPVRASALAPIPELAPETDFQGPSLMGRLIGLTDPFLRRDEETQQAENAP